VVRGDQISDPGALELQLCLPPLLPTSRAWDGLLLSSSNLDVPVTPTREG
jgi:hypothetical protein